MKRVLYILFVLLLACSLAACGAKAAPAQTETIECPAETAEVGEGAKEFTFYAIDADGNASAFLVHTDASTVGEALSSLDLIEGENSSFGLYVKTVNGITADYDKDGCYWAFYIGDEYAATGVDSTEITDGASYTLKIEK